MVLEMGPSSFPKIILKYSPMEKMATTETSTANNNILPFMRIHKSMGTSMSAVIHRLMCCMPPYRTVGPSPENFSRFQ